MKIAFHRKRVFLGDLESAQLKERLAPHAFADWLAGDEPPSRDLDVLLAVGALDRATIATQPNLFFIQTTSAGYEEIDIDAATDAGIWVSSAPAGETGNAISVAEAGIMLMIGASRFLNRELASVRDHTIRTDRLATSLFGKTACIVGLGSVGRAIAERLRPFGMKLRGTDPHPEHAPPGVDAMPPERLHDAVRDADYVVVCAPGDAKNDGLVDGALLAAMKDGAILVNVARGSLVDETALAAAVRSGHIAAAGLDVLRVEPADPKNPLLELPQVLITPHIAGGTDLMLAGTLDFIAGVVADLDAGKKPKSVLNAPPHPRRPLS